MGNIKNIKTVFFNASGMTGVQGEKGDTGDKGDKGLKGETGDSYTLATTQIVTGTATDAPNYSVQTGEIFPANGYSAISFLLGFDIDSENPTTLNINNTGNDEIISNKTPLTIPNNATLSFIMGKDNKHHLCTIDDPVNRTAIVDDIIFWRYISYENYKECWTRGMMQFSFSSDTSGFATFKFPVAFNNKPSVMISYADIENGASSISFSNAPRAFVKELDTKKAIIEVQRTGLNKGKTFYLGIRAVGN